MTVAVEYRVVLRRPHDHQARFIDSQAKRKVIRAGRRGGKTVGIATGSVKKFLAGRRVLYAAPTADQLQAYWFEVKRALAEPLDAGVFYKNETDHVIEIPGTKQRIRAKTAYNADTLRGDYADDLYLDEWQLMSEDAWELVGAPMLLDNNGDATFIYTPPSLHSTSVSKARDPQHAAKLFKRALLDQTGRWATFHFSSRDNPHISAEAIDELAEDMTALAYRMEIEAEDVDEAPGALWTREIIQRNRVAQLPEPCHRIVVAIDPSESSTGDEAGIITAGRITKQGYLLSDNSVQGSPKTWATAAVNAYHEYEADCIVAEKNSGGEMIQEVIATVDPHIKVVLVWASRGKQTRAEPVAAVYEHNRAHHVGSFPLLEDEMCLWTPGDRSPNRMDAMVWAFTELGLTAKRTRIFNL
jgi:Terminase RNaseH-like domain